MVAALCSCGSLHTTTILVMVSVVVYEHKVRMLYYSLWLYVFVLIQGTAQVYLVVNCRLILQNFCSGK